MVANIFLIEGIELLAVFLVFSVYQHNYYWMAPMCLIEATQSDITRMCNLDTGMYNTDNAIIPSRKTVMKIACITKLSIESKRRSLPGLLTF